MSAPILNLQNITYTLGGRPLLDGASLSILAGERLCLVGRNGCGKSTFLRLMAGHIHPDGGLYFIQPGLKVYYLAQEPDLSNWGTTYEYVASVLDDLSSYRARSMLAELGLTGDEPCKNLSGGEARRCALAQALASDPDLILLDEPTNHLDIPCISWLERELKASHAAMILISHDRRFLENVCRAVIWLDQGTTRRLDANFSHFETWRDEQLELAQRDAHKLSRHIAREEDWMRYGVTARRKRNVRRVAELADLRAQRRDIASRQRGALKMAASEADNTSKIVISADHISWSFPERPLPLIDDLTLKVTRGDRLGICGANGTGKTTLLRLLTGQLSPQKGDIRLSPSAHMVTLDQQRSALDGDRSVVDVLTNGHGEMVQIGSEKRHVMGYMKDFLFRPQQARTPVSQLSGGERGRLVLACALARPSNLLVLDEPTNDLDLETLDLLQDMLADYAGTVLLVSHDRDFLDRLTSSILVAEETGKWIEYAGGYSDMLAQRQGKAPQERRLPNTAPNEPPKEMHAAPAPQTKIVNKLSYKERLELKELTTQITKLEKDVSVCQKALNDPELYRRDPARFEKLTEILHDVEHKLSQVEERWLDLESKREELEG